MHNNIMTAGSRDRPPMLAPGRYPQWHSRFLRYVDTRPNGEALRKCILSGPYKSTTILVHDVEATDNSLVVPKHTTVETPANMSPENKAHFLAEKEAIHLILDGIGDNIYSTVDACQTAQEIWKAIERLQQGVNVQFLQQLQPEWSRFVTIFKQQHKLDEVSYHKLFDILKQYQNEVNELRAEKLARNANPLALFRTQRTVNVAGTKEKVRSQVVQKSGNQCFNCKEYGHFAKESRKPKRVNSAYHKEKMLLCKQAEQDSSSDSEPVEQVQNDNGYNVFANALQHSKQFESFSNTCLVETDDSNVTPDSPDICEDDIQNEQNDVESDDEHVALVNLIANLKLDVDENKKIHKQLKKANTTLAQELREYKAILAKTSKSLGESISVRDSCLVAIQTKQTGFKKYKAFNDRLSKPVTAQTIPQTTNKAVSNTHVLRPDLYRIENKPAHTRAPQLLLTVRDTNLRVSTSTRLNYKPNVSRPQLKSNQSRDKVLPKNSQVKVKKTQVEVHPRIPSVSNKMKSVTTCKDSLNSRTLNANAVCATCNKCLVDSNHFACVTKMLNDVHARTKKPNVVPISTRKPNSQANKSIATNNKKKVASKSISQKPHSYFRIVQLILFIVDSGCTKHMMGNLKLLCNFVEKFLGLNHNLFSVGQFSDADLEFAFMKSTCFVRDLQGNSLLVVIIVRTDRGTEFLNKTLDAFFKEEGTEHQTSTARTPEQNGVVERRNRTLVEVARTILLTSQLPLFFWAEAIATASDADVPSQQELDLLFGPLYDKFFNAGSTPSTNIQSTSAPSSHTNVHDKENNNDKAEKGEQLQDNKLTNPFYALAQEEVKSSSYNIDPEMCMFAFTVSTAEPKNIKEAMVDFAWTEAMQEELH
nr:putative ribonuclease H-like domain-containing protein [Tanacetum cinerariifolium]